MSEPSIPIVPPRGPIAWMANNPVAGNLAIVLILIGGFMSALRIKQEVFPEFTLDVVTVTVAYPGASPSEVEQGIVLAVEEAVRGVDGVKRVTSRAAEGVGTVTVETLIGANREKVLNDVKNEVDRITTLPLDAEEPQVILGTNRQRVISLVIAGDHPLQTLDAIAERARSDLLASKAVTQVEVQGVPPLEVSVEVPRETLDAYGLTLEQIAGQIRLSSLELPGGGVDTRAGEILVRMADRRKTGEALGDVVVRGTNGGAVVRLRDIATITDGYADTDQAAFYNGLPAVRVTAFRVGEETPIDVADAVKAYVPTLQAAVGPDTTIAVWDDDSQILLDRIDLLVRNGQMGLILVVFSLALFLELRLALWVAFGIPVSFMGAFMLMPVMGVSINMISLFALIVTLGIVVDDAIVIGEHTWFKMSQGIPPLQAAIEAGREMAVPVTFSVLTTMAAFAPLLFVPGFSGKIFRIIPMVVIIVLAVSLVESFLVLPGHLGHGKARTGWFWDLIDKPRVRASAWLERFSDGPFRRLVLLSTELRYATMAAAAAAFIVTIGGVASGLVPFTFFPSLEGDVASASIRLPYGAPLEATIKAREQLEASARVSLDALGPEALVAMFTSVGEGPDQGFGVREVSGNLATVEVQFVPTDQRSFTAADFVARWIAETPPIPGAESVVITSSFGPGGGADVALQLAHTDPERLAAASDELVRVMRSYPAITNVQSTFSGGKPQIDLSLLPGATTLGLTSEGVARQVRSAFFGAEAVREQRDRNELKVMVRLPEAQRASAEDIADLRIRAGASGSVALGEVAKVTPNRAPTVINREDGRRIVTVSAENAPGVKSVQDVVTALQETDLPAMMARDPGLTWSAAGDQREQAETFGSLGPNFLIAMFAIYGLLAIPFKSYTQPIIIMLAIPLGFVSAVAGHVALGYELSIISMFGVIALAGVAVNDSIVLIDTANTFRADGMGPFEAVTQASIRRLRPIMLTSLTTFLGLAPMIFETSVQARFLIPMAISLGFGVLGTTLVALFVVPAVYMALEDVHRLVRWAFSGPEPAPVETS
jgi:multidrug efflux pump subunit AcrB